MVHLILTSSFLLQGCVDAIYNAIKNNLVAVGVVVIVLGIIEVGAIAAAWFLSNRIDA